MVAAAERQHISELLESGCRAAETIAGVSSRVSTIKEGIQYGALFKEHGAALGYPSLDVRHQKPIGQPYLESLLRVASVPSPGHGTGIPRGGGTPIQNSLFTRDGTV